MSEGVVSLGSYLLSLKDGTHGTHTRSSKGVKLLSAKNIRNDGTVVWDESDDCVSEKEADRIRKSFDLTDGDLLLTIVGSLGRCAKYRGEPVVFQRSVAFLKPDKARINNNFLFHLITHQSFQKELIRRSNATAQAGVYLGEIAKIPVYAPAMNDQNAIAAILDILDSAIRKTEAIIDKLKMIKQGLLNDLLTRGVDENGKLRPPREEAPELYEESKLGWIPKGWEVPRLSEVTTYVDYRGKTPNKSNQGVFLVTAKNIHDGRIDYSISREFIRPSDYDTVMSRGVPSQGDVLFTTEAPLGNVTQVDRTPIALAQRIIKYRGLDTILNEYLCLELSSVSFQARLRREATGSTVLGIKGSRLHQMRIRLPPWQEQQKIMSAFRTIEMKIGIEEEYNEKNRAAKSALMDDLLTGRVRVTSLLAAHPELGQATDGNEAVSRANGS